MRDPDVIRGDFTWGELLLAVIAVVALCCIAAGCYQEPEATRVVGVTAWSDGAVTGDVLARACAVWEPLGISCASVADRASADVVVSSYHDPSDGRLGWEDPWGTVVTVQVNLAQAQDDNTVVTTVAHEMGHALGLGHLGPGPAVMNVDATIYNWPVLTSTDIAGWRALVGKEGP